MFPSIRPDHAAIYIRWSTEDQGEGTTLAVQREACEHYLLSQGWSVREDLVFIDDGWSGGSLDRPALGRLRNRVRCSEIDCVVVYKLDRLSRNVVDTVNLVLQEWEDRTYLHSAREPIDTANAMGKQFFYMLVSYAEWERSVIRERMFSGKLRRARDGRSPGMRRAYGYGKGEQTGTFAVVPAEADVVRMVFLLADQGQSVRQITRHLNQLRIPSRQGRPWSTSTISRLLRNPIYTGRLVWGRWQLNPRWRKAAGVPRLRRSQPHVDRLTAVIPPLVTPEEFERVARRLGENRKLAPAAQGSVHLLSGLIRCSACGSAMEHNSAGASWRYLRCRGRVQQGICQAPSVPAEAVETAVLQSVRLRYEPLVRSAEAHTGAGEAERLQAFNALAAARLGQQLRQLSHQVRRVNRDYREGHLTPVERRQLLADITAEQSALRTRQQQLQAEASNLAEQLQVNPSAAAGPGGADLWRELPPERQKAILRRLIRSVRAGTGAAPEELAIQIEWLGPAPTGLSP